MEVYRDSLCRTAFNSGYVFSIAKSTRRTTLEFESFQNNKNH